MTDVPANVRAAVIVRAEGRCEYCQFPQELQTVSFEIDHIVPRSLGGETTLDNLALACGRCNAHKWAHRDALDPESRESVLLFNPRTDHWDAHFEWSRDSSFELVGKTSCGRATIDRLQMNHPRIVAIRRQMAAYGIAVAREDVG